MARVVALLAAVIACLALTACGDDGAEPGASREATLALDFQPNAVHAGIYVAPFAEHGIDLTIQEPSASTDAPKLLAAGRADLAILDIHDLAIARQRGIPVVGVGAVVQRPLAAVIAGDGAQTASPADLEGGTVGVTGLPSDDAVLDAVLSDSGVDPSAVERVTIGFDSIAALSAGKVDAATAFWNAEGVALRGLGVPTREFRVDDHGAPRYPELVIVTGEETLAEDRQLVDDALEAIAAGYEAVPADPEGALDELIEGVPELDRDEQRAQLDALLEADAFTPPVDLDRAVLEDWAAWDLEQGIVERQIDVSDTFPEP